MDETPITERSCDITENIDVAAPEDMVRLLYESDKRIFNGYKQWRNLYSYCDVIETIITEAISVLQAENSCVVLSGCGTSGRLGFLTAQSFNHILARDLKMNPKFRYLLAGGDEALFLSKELIEDDPKAGIDDLIEKCKDKHRVLYIGITCGLSAPYVAGQLEYAFNHPEKFYPVLIGFNPLELSRNLPVENWDKTFRDVAMNFNDSDCGVVLNPVYGPEPITGSSRMKGGTTTKVLLETIFSCAILRVINPETSISARNIMRSYSAIQDTVFGETNKIAKGIARFGYSLQKSGHIYYLSSQKVGVLGLIDASECPPTYGAHVDDVRGFIDGGYKTLETNEGEGSHLLNISCSYFKDKILPTLSPSDTVCILQKCDSLESCLASCNANIIRINIAETVDTRSADNNTICINFPTRLVYEILQRDVALFMQPFHEEIAVKWVLNSLTTGAHILKGKVYKNRMIDVRVRNDKLYRRAIGIVEKCAEVSQPVAEQCLLRAIYRTDTLRDHICEKPISAHICQASQMENVVPLSIILAKHQCGIDRANEVLCRSPVLRQAIVEISQ